MSTVNGAARSAGPRPAAQPRTSVSRATASSWRTLDHLNARSHVPIVDGARVSSNNSGAAPARSTSTSSMLSPPASIAPTTVTAFAPQKAAPGPAASFTRASTSPAMPRRCTSNAGATRPRVGYQTVLVKGHRHAREIVRCFHPTDALRLGYDDDADTVIVPGHRAFVVQAAPRSTASTRWIQGKSRDSPTGCEAIGCRVIRRPAIVSDYETESLTASHTTSRVRMHTNRSRSQLWMGHTHDLFNATSRPPSRRIAGGFEHVAHGRRVWGCAAVDGRRSHCGAVGRRRLRIP